MLFEKLSDEQLGEILAELLRQHREKWMGLVRRFVRNPADAEDVVQEAARRLLEHPPRFGSVEEIRMYFRRTVRNTAIEAYRSRRRNRRREVRLVDHRIGVLTNATPEARLEAIERSERLCRVTQLVREGLRLLPSKNYDALVRVVLNTRGTSIREEGAQAGVPYSTLRGRSAQAVRRLRRFVERSQRSGGAGPSTRASAGVRRGW